MGSGKHSGTMGILSKIKAKLIEMKLDMTPPGSSSPGGKNIHVSYLSHYTILIRLHYFYERVFYNNSVASSKI